MIKIDEVAGTTLIRDYLKWNHAPSLDSLLDWRNQLIKIRQDEKEHLIHVHFVNLEIKAVDYLLQEHYS